jgi:hypothetical protein
MGTWKAVLSLVEEFCAMIVIKGAVAGIGLFGHAASAVEVAFKLMLFVFHIFLHCFLNYLNV